MRDNLKATWEGKADAWSGQAGDPRNYFTRRSAHVAQLVNRRLSCGCVLDVGCGPGLLCELLARQGLDVYGTDLAENMVAESRRRLASLIPDSRLHFQVYERGRAPFPNRAFDVITAIGVLNYAENWADSVAEFSTRLTPTGLLVVSCTNRRSLFVMWAVIHHVLRLRHFLLSRVREWFDMLGNLIRTGIWSGGYVDRRAALQCYSAAGLDELLAGKGFRKVDELDLFRCPWLDRQPLARTRIGRVFARKLGWNHIGVYARVEEKPGVS